MKGILRAIKAASGWLGTTTIGLLVNALHNLALQLDRGDVEKIEKILRVVERVCNTALDVSLKVRAAINDNQLTVEEGQQLVQMVRNRVSEIDAEKNLLEMEE